MKRSALLTRRDDIYIYKYAYVRVWALYTQGRYMSLRLYTQGCYMGLGPLYPGMLAGDYVHIRVCAQIHRDLARDDIHTYT